MMKKIISYAAALLGATMLLAGCSQDDTTATTSADNGILKMQIATTRSGEETGYDPMDHLMVRIYNSDDKLIRRYNLKSDIPAELELLKGTYTVRVEAGEVKGADTAARFYKGEKSFEVTAGGITNAEVICNLQNVVAEVKFDATVAPIFGTAINAWVLASDSFDLGAAETGLVPALEFTADGTGYFTLPEGTTSLYWHFEGTPTAGGAAIVKEGAINDVVVGNKYILTFKYSKDLPGFLDVVTVRVDPTTDDYNDTIIFSPDPTVTGVDFDIEESQDYISGKTAAKSYKITTLGALKGISLTIGDTKYDAINGTTDGIAYTKNSNYEAIVTLSDAILSKLAGGEQTISMRITDADGADAIKTSTYRVQGVLPTTASDYDLWTNSVTLRALVLDTEASSVELGLRKANGEWKSATATATGENIYTATLSAEWVESTNEGDQTIYTPNTATGVFAGNSYESRAVINTKAFASAAFTTAGKQVIPDGNMEASLPCFTSNSKNTTFWGSGNAATSGLCAQSTKGGMGGNACAKLKAQVTFNNLAAGNLFTATFAFTSLTGYVEFGMPYDWQARPTAMRLKMHAKVGSVNRGTAASYEYIADGQDRSRIYMTIIDWDNRHETSTSLGSPSGTWDPVKATSTSEGPIIAYGSLLIGESTTGDNMVTVDIPIHYYDKVTKPSKTYSLIISCATSAYGDYKVGCDTNEMYVDDFEWVY